MATLKIATFNVENLFGRVKVLNLKSKAEGDKLLAKIGDLQKLLKQKTYSATDKTSIVKSYKALSDYIEIKEDRGKLFAYAGRAIKGINAKVNGSGDWDGSIEFKKENFSEVARENTAKTIKLVNADITCVVEAENRIALKDFDSHLMNNKYKFEMLIDGNDPRGIDVGLLSKFPLGRLETHIFDKAGNTTIFSRDCLEIEVILSKSKSLFLLCNHFKSKGYGAAATSDAKRKKQAERVAEILKKYDLKKDYILVMGDFNDTSLSAPLKPLLGKRDLHDVLKLQFPKDPDKRWTYHYKQFEQIDFILISEALKPYFLEAGVERRGIYELEKLTSNSKQKVDVEKELPTVNHWTNAASDHGAVWAKFNL